MLLTKVDVFNRLNFDILFAVATRLIFDLRCPGTQFYSPERQICGLLQPLIRIPSSVF